MANPQKLAPNKNKSDCADNHKGSRGNQERARARLITIYILSVNITVNTMQKATVDTQNIMRKQSKHNSKVIKPQGKRARKEGTKRKTKQPGKQSTK